MRPPVVAFAQPDRLGGRVEERRLAAGLDLVQRAAERREVAGQRLLDLHLLREGDERHLVAWREAVHERVGRAAQFGELVPGDAAADVEEKIGVDRHLLERHLVDLLPDAVVEHVEVPRLQPFHVLLAARHGDVHRHDFDAAAKGRLLGLLRGRARRQGEEHDGEGGEREWMSDHVPLSRAAAAEVNRRVSEPRRPCRSSRPSSRSSAWRARRCRTAGRRERRPGRPAYRA